MKKFLKFGAVLAALVLALTCFVACQNDDDNNNNDGPKTVAEYISDNYKFEFKDDGNFNVYEGSDTTARAASWTLIATGTYTGDAKAGTGTVTMTVVKVEKENDEKIKVGTYEMAAGTNGEITITGTVNNETVTITVTKAGETTSDPDPDPDPDPEPANELVGTVWKGEVDQGENQEDKFTLTFTSATELTIVETGFFPEEPNSDTKIDVSANLTGTYTVSESSGTITVGTKTVETTTGEATLGMIESETLSFTINGDTLTLDLGFSDKKGNACTLDFTKQTQQ